MADSSQPDPLKTPMRSWRGLHDVRFLINTSPFGGKLPMGPYHPAELVVMGAVGGIGVLFLVAYGSDAKLSGAFISLVGFLSLMFGARYAVQKTLELEPSPRSRLRGWWRSKFGAQPHAYYVHGRPWRPLYSSNERSFLEAASQTRARQRQEVKR